MLNILIQALCKLCEFIKLMIVIRALLSWIIRDYSNPVLKMIDVITEPVIYPFRKIISNSPFGNMGGLDISPVFAYLAVELVSLLLQSVLL